MRNLTSINSLKAYIIKEVIEGIRTHRFLVLAVGILFFSIADPVMLKLMPLILKNQMGGMDFSSMIELNQRTAMANYAKDLFQLSTLVVVLSLMGIISAERSSKTLTIPVSMGCRVGGIQAGKLLVYGTYLMFLTVLGMYIVYYYSGIIFGFDYNNIIPVIRAGFLYGVYYVFVLSTLLLLSSLVKKTFIAGIVTLLISYTIPVLNNIKGLGRYLPSYLLKEANYFSSFVPKDLTVSLIVTFGLILIFNILTLTRLENIEFV